MLNLKTRTRWLCSTFPGSAENAATETAGSASQLLPRKAWGRQDQIVLLNIDYCHFTPMSRSRKCSITLRLCSWRVSDIRKPATSFELSRRPTAKKPKQQRCAHSCSAKRSANGCSRRSEAEFSKEALSPDDRLGDAGASGGWVVAGWASRAATERQLGGNGTLDWFSRSNFGRGSSRRNARIDFSTVLRLSGIGHVPAPTQDHTGGSISA